MMIPAGHRRRESLAPALAAAAALHLAIFLLAGLLSRSDLTPMGTAVPINIVASGPTTDSRAAEAAPDTQTPQTETPVPQAKAPTPPPAPRAAPPAPAPPVRAVKPPPPPKAISDHTAKPQPAPAPTPARDSFSLDSLAASVARAARPAPPRPAFAARGAYRPETAPVARVDAGTGVSQSDIAGLSQLLERLWNPNCDTAGGEGLVVPVQFRIGDDGRVVGRVSAGGREAAADPVLATAARRAMNAVRQAEPYALPYRDKAFTVNFDAKTACATH